MDATTPTTKRPKPARYRRYGLVCLIPLVFLIATLIRLQTQNVPDRQLLPPNPPFPHPNAADTFADAAQQFDHNGGLKKFLPKGRRGEGGIVSVQIASRGALRKLVRANRKVLVTFRKGMTQPCQYPYPPLEGPYNTFSEEIELSEFLVAEGRTHQIDEQWRAAADSYLDVYEFGTRIADNKALGNVFMGIVVEFTGMTFLDELLDQCDTTTAAHIESRLQNLYARLPNFADAMQKEGLYQQYMLQHWGAGESKLTLTEIFGESYSMTAPDHLQFHYPNPPPAPGDWIIDAALRVYYRLNKRDVLQTNKRYWDAVVADMRRPWRNLDLESRMPRDLINPLIVPRYLSAWADSERKRAQTQLLIIKAALKVYRAQHGAYPKTLAALPLKPSLIADPFRNAPMVYVLPYDDTLAELKLYSVGDDGKDDGGETWKDVCPCGDCGE